MFFFVLFELGRTQQVYNSLRETAHTNIFDIFLILYLCTNMVFIFNCFVRHTCLLLRAAVTLGIFWNE